MAVSMRLPFFIVSLLTTATASATVMIVAVAIIGLRYRNVLSAKFCCWERHRAEYAARIVFFDGDTFLFRNAVFGCLNQILCRAHNADNRENAERNGKITLAASSLSTAVAKAKRCLKASVYRLGNVSLAAATAAGAFADTLYNACSKKNGRDDLNDCRRLVFFVAFLGRATAEVLTHTVAFENADVALATVKDNPFFEYGDAFNLLRASRANASLKYKFYVKTNVNRVKSAVKANRLDIDTRPNDLCTLGANRACVLQNFISKIRKINACIFKAIAVAAGIQNATGINADGLARGIGPRHARKFIFCHSQISFKIISENYSLC